MRTHRYLLVLAVSLLSPSLLACGSASPGSSTAPTADAGDEYGVLPRLRFNQLAMRLGMPVFWSADDDGDRAIDPSEVRSLLFYPGAGAWVENGAFTEAFQQAYAAVVRESQRAVPADERARLVREEFGSVAPTLVHNDLRQLPEGHRVFAQHMMRVASLIDDLYARQVGMAALASQVPGNDTASQSLFRRNWGPRCKSQALERNAACSAIPGSPAQPVDVYPAPLQADDGFCAVLEARENSEALLAPFTVVRERDGELVAVPYSEHYADESAAIAAELRAAAEGINDAAEGPLVAYLRAAAQSFTDNVWGPTDEAWASMNARNSRWYLRVGPDEVYWDPCSRKAGFHMTFALINSDSLAWQDRLTPLQGDMEAALAALAPEVYEARDVGFHMPDFIDIVLNSGDDRNAFGATVGQSLPNWGAVADEGRGRTVAMSNLYTDPDSQIRRRAVSESLFTAGALAPDTDSVTAGLLSTILHEATHNLGPAHEYRVNGQTSAEAFGGGMASMFEELKAQSGALFYLQLLRDRGIITEADQLAAYLDSLSWALGHISRGMYTPSGQRKAYSQLAAVHIGFLMDQGVVSFDPEAPAANGTDIGAFNIDYENLPAAANQLMQRVMQILAGQDRAAAEALAERYVDGDVVPRELIAERYGRVPKTSFVYSVDL